MEGWINERTGGEAEGRVTMERGELQLEEETGSDGERISRWRPWSSVSCSWRRNTTLLSTLPSCRDRLLSSPMAESGGAEERK
ncbi:hypothetical protein EYF80_045746 [Liparis tanakae]|uniref:Uncharacterized protein n=1 Tax=Liparis tanakae TaxID=230148 RepID=A0A4Z2FST5_9TELE|nr:hypothetical protein EYF80_045746 [Liparis tanakae]